MSRRSTMWCVFLVSPVCFVLTVVPVRAGVQTGTDDKAAFSRGSEDGSSANDLGGSTLAAYIESLQRAVDEALIQGFWKFGIDGVGSNYSRGMVKLRCAVSPSARFWVKTVLSNTSNEIFAYVAQDAVRTALRPAFPPELIRYYPTGLSMDLSVAFEDVKQANYPQPITQLRVSDPSRVKHRQLDRELNSRGLGTYIDRVHALPILVSSRS